MKKFYRMLIEHLRTGERRTYVSARQGSAPAGWKCIGVVGYYEQPSRNNQEDQQHTTTTEGATTA